MLQAIIDDIKVGLRDALKHNLIPKKGLHTLIGKINHAAGLLIVLRPFLEPLWAAWSAPSPPEHPGCVWRKQILLELQ